MNDERNLTEYTEELDYSMEEHNFTPKDGFNKGESEDSSNLKRNAGSVLSDDNTPSPSRKNRKFQKERKDLDQSQGESIINNTNNNCTLSCSSKSSRQGVRGTRSRKLVSNFEHNKNISDLINLERKPKRGRPPKKIETVTTPISEKNVTPEKSNTKTSETEGQRSRSKPRETEGHGLVKHQSESCTTIDSNVTNMTDDTDTIITFKESNKQVIDKIGMYGISDDYRKSRDRSRSRSPRRRKRHDRSRSRSRDDRRERRRKKHKKRQRRYSRSTSSESSSSEEDEIRNRRRYRQSKERQPSDYEIQNDPRIQEMVLKMVKDQLDQVKAKAEGGETNRQNNNKAQGTSESIPSTINTREDVNIQNEVVKSPSEATLYVPAVPCANRKRSTDDWDINTIKQKLEFFNNSSEINKNFPHMSSRDSVDPNIEVIGNESEDNIARNQTQFNIEQLDKIISSIRLDTKHKDNKYYKNTAVAGTSDQAKAEQAKAAAKAAAERAIIEAEKFKAAIEPPKGRYNNSNHELEMFHIEPKSNEDYQLMLARYYDKDDDDFFHITCHVESSLRQRIERGEFVELECLLQKMSNYKEQSDEGKKMALVNKNGMTYFVPQNDRECKINNVRKWEQAFRIYAAIYCGKNQNRSVEVLQYIDVINRAVATYSWENVARYDYTFRQLMAAKPHRSWAKTYTQMWNLTLNDPVKRLGNDSNSHSTASSKYKTESICWKFNKNKCKYSDKDCKFEHKCSYCGGTGHGQFNCFKRIGKKDQKGKWNWKRETILFNRN